MRRDIPSKKAKLAAASIGTFRDCFSHLLAGKWKASHSASQQLPVVAVVVTPNRERESRFSTASLGATASRRYTRESIERKAELFQWPSSRRRCRAHFG